MSFISFSFLFLFLITLAGRFWLGPNKNEKPYLVLLLVASLVFYGSFIPWYLSLLLFTTLVDFYAGRKIDESTSPAHRKAYLVLSLTANLGLLGFFKYSNFFLDMTHLFTNGVGGHLPPFHHLDLVLPIGISFFTFQSMSYTIDIYRGQLKPEKSYWRFLLFVSFFTHLISGPIVRARELLYQFDRKRRVRLKVFLQGFYLIISGLFFKIVVADNLAFYVDFFWKTGAADRVAAADPLCLAVFFSCQIFADFLGYTNIALGLAYLLGFKLPTNFRSPYIAASFREFWTRWHITLSTWIRDYLYIPLGGNRGSKFRVFLTLMATMLLAGLWHGAALTFLVWGGIHGAALFLERLVGVNRLQNSTSRLLKLCWFLLVQAVVLVGWVFFRAENLGQALRILGNLSNGGFSPEYVRDLLPAFWFVVPVVLLHGRTFLVERGLVPSPGPLEKGTLAALMLYGLLTIYGKANAFIYFQF